MVWGVYGPPEFYFPPIPNHLSAPIPDSTTPLQKKKKIKELLNLKFDLRKHYMQTLSKSISAIIHKLYKKNNLY